MRILIALICLALPAATSAQDHPAIALLQAGVLCGPEVVGSAPAPDTIAGETHIVADQPAFIAETLTVPAVLGIGFGLRAQASDPDGLPDVTIIVTHPPMGPDGITRQSYQSAISGISPSMSFYQFDAAYELVTGRWTFAAEQGGELLFTVSFDVVPPAALPGLASVCEGRQLLF
jgi:hypothetical protein